MQFLKGTQDSFISLTGTAKNENSKDPGVFTASRLHNQNTIEYLDIRQLSYNVKFNPIEFKGFYPGLQLYKYRLPSTAACRNMHCLHGPGMFPRPSRRAPRLVYNVKCTPPATHQCHYSDNPGFLSRRNQPIAMSPVHL